MSGERDPQILSSLIGLDSRKGIILKNASFYLMIVHEHICSFQRSQPPKFSPILVKYQQGIRENLGGIVSRRNATTKKKCKLFRSFCKAIIEN